MSYKISVSDSIRDILLTPLGSRVCLPDYGSRLHELVDKRFDSVFKAKLVQYVYEAAVRYEKRAKISKVSDISVNNNKLTFTVNLDNGESVVI